MRKLSMLASSLSGRTSKPESAIDKILLDTPVDGNGGTLVAKGLEAYMPSDTNDILLVETSDTIAPISTTSTGAGTTEYLTYSQYTPEYPYCPVFVSKKKDKGVLYRVYLHGGIIGVREYTTLINTLFAMKPEDTIISYIDSPGGNLLTGATLSTALACCKGETIAEACGICASAGSLYFTEHQKHVVAPFATLMYHMSSHQSGGNSMRIRDTADTSVRYVTEKCLSRALQKGHLTKDEFDRITTKFGEAWISAEDMIQRIKANTTTSVLGTESLHEDLLNLSQTSAYLDEMSDYTLGIEQYSPDDSSGANKFTFSSASDLNSLDFKVSYALAERQYLNGTAIAATDVTINNGREVPFSISKIDDHQFVIILDEDINYWNAKIITAFCRTLDNLDSSDTITILLPGGIPTWAISRLGSMISAMARCKGKIITRMAGIGGMMDAFVWMYGTERILDQYGIMSFDPDILDERDFMATRGEYLKVFMNKAVAIDLITKEQVASFYEDKRQIVVGLNQ